VFEYDKNKSSLNRKKHGIDFGQATSLWDDPKRVEFLARFSDEARLGLVAGSGGKLWTAIFTKREDRIRIILVRRARQNEESLYNDSSGI
jgi:uncharacterized DUF497 family protein